MSDSVTINGREFRCSTARPAPMNGAVFGIVGLLLNALVAGILMLIFLPLGVAWLALALLFAVVPVVMATGGACPNCTGRVVLPIRAATKCPKCRHRVALHEGRLVDFG